MGLCRPLPDFDDPRRSATRLPAPQRDYPLRELFNALRWLVRTGSPWRYVPHDLPPWHTVYEQTQHWIAAGCFQSLVEDLTHLLRKALTRNPEPSAAIFDGRTLQSTIESGSRAGYDGYKRKRGSKVHLAVDTLGNLLAALLVHQGRTQE